MADLSDKVSESEEMGSRNPSPERSGGGVNPKTCLDCGTSKTPLWRGGPAGPKTLCNACGIRSRKKRRALLGINKEDRDRKVKKTSSNNSSTTSSSKSSTIVVDQVDRRSKSSNIVVDQIDRRNKISTVVVDKTDRRSKISAVVVDQTDRRSKISTVVADQTDRSSKDENSCKSNTSSSGENNAAAAATSAKYGETLRKKLVAFGRDFVMQRPRSKKSNGGQRRKMGEVEQAAFLLMALSCGSVYA